MELATNADAAAAFVNGIVPAKVGKVDKAQIAQQNPALAAVLK